MKIFERKFFILDIEIAPMSEKDFLFRHNFYRYHTKTPQCQMSDIADIATMSVPTYDEIAN
jgi:hypothetical protein